MTAKGRSILDPFFNDVLADYRGGMSAAAIGRKYKTTTTTVTSFLKRHACFEHFGRGERFKVSEDESQKIVDLYKGGTHIKEIEAITGRSKSCIFSVLKANGVGHRGLVDYHPSYEAKVSMAIGKEAKGNLNDAEQYVFDSLQSAGFECVPQLRFDIYNADIAIPSASVAVEVTCRGTFGKYSRSGFFTERVKKLSEFGWSVYFIVSRDADSLSADGIDDLIEWIKFRHASPTVAREYRMVRSPAKLLAAGRSDGNEVASVLALENIVDLAKG